MFDRLDNLLASPFENSCKWGAYILAFEQVPGRCLAALYSFDGWKCLLPTMPYPYLHPNSGTQNQKDRAWPLAHPSIRTVEVVWVAVR